MNCKKNPGGRPTGKLHRTPGQVARQQRRAGEVRTKVKPVWSLSKTKPVIEDLDALTVPELYQRAKAAGFPVTTKTRKGELVTLLRVGQALG